MKDDKRPDTGQPFKDHFCICAAYGSGNDVSAVVQHGGFHRSGQFCRLYRPCGGGMLLADPFYGHCGLQRPFQRHFHRCRADVWGRQASAYPLCVHHDADFFGPGIGGDHGTGQFVCPAYPGGDEHSDRCFGGSDRLFEDLFLWIFVHVLLQHAGGCF